jgi:hypothetical protein
MFSPQAISSRTVHRQTIAAEAFMSFSGVRMGITRPFWAGGLIEVLRQDCARTMRPSPCGHRAEIGASADQWHHNNAEVMAPVQR